MLKEMNKYRPAIKPLLIGCLFIIFYILLIFFLPDHSNSQLMDKLTNLEYKEALFLVQIPAMIVWLLAFYAYSRLNSYAITLKKTPSYKALKTLSKGILLLALSMPISSILSRFLNLFEGYNQTFYHVTIIITNYINLFLPFAAFIIIYYSAKKITHRAQINYSLASSKFLILIYVVAGVIYSYETLKAFSGNSLISINNVYHLPVFIFIITILIPYLYSWFIGLTTSYDINAFATKLVGVIYRRALYFISLGLATVIISLIASQYVTTITPTYGHLAFNFHTILSIVFKVITGIGFYLLAHGANKLIKIEEL
jgi:hypothetical protein